MTVILSAEDIEAGYNSRPVIKGLTFSVRDGDVLAVIGPNGSGKTTLLKAVLGMIPLRRGRLSFSWKKGVDRERLIAYIPQRMEVDRTFPLSLKEMLGLSLPGAPVEKYIDMLELRGLLSERVGDLSGGQMQRALLAYAIIKEPQLLIMDEPTSWIDAKGADCVLCIMEEFRKKGIAMIIVSHDFSVIKAAATSVLGLGPEGYFFEPVDSPLIDEKLMSLFGTLHHNACITCKPEKGLG
ncbi:MAG: metal ABC transporter ATP-binding protein [Thermodesulfovibrionales bacterium]|nr:metal ABC transporter ATP-binding protein [Thermodesulfovibrionales bacterium]